MTNTDPSNQPVILAARRTVVGRFLGGLSRIPSPEIGSWAIKAAVEDSGVNPGEIDECVMGCVLQAGVGQNPARQAGLKAGLPSTLSAVTVNKVCGSGLQAVMQAATSIKAGETNTVVAGGMESMSNAPYYLFKARQGYRMGDGKLVDGMIFDGLWDPYNNMHMGMCGEMCAEEYKIDRKAQDDFTLESYRRAQEAQKNGKFDAEIVPVEIPQRKGDPIVVSVDEEPGNARFDKIPALKPAFKKDGTITAANASKINDGAAAVVLTSADLAKEMNLQVLAKVHSQAVEAQAPEWFTTSPAGAIRKAVAKTTKSDGSTLLLDEVDLFEINEAFSVVGIVNTQLLKLDPAKVNVHGGAVALGHPIGASGARILITLLSALKDRNLTWGVAGICLGGGEAVSLVIERV